MSAGGRPAFSLEGVRHFYGRRCVLQIDRLEIARGRTLGVIGPSGAGKSTLLRLLQGLERPTEGRIHVDGAPLSYPAPLPLARRITTVFQRPLMLDRSVRENVEYGLRLRGRREGESLDLLLDQLGLAHLARARARKLSGGEVQRVALARALAVQPDVLLLDEPAANLDPAHVALVESLIRDAQSRGTTIVLVTHNTHEARRLADDALLLIDGTVVEAGPTAGFFASPAEAQTRAFLAGEIVY